MTQLPKRDSYLDLVTNQFYMRKKLADLSKEVAKDLHLLSLLSAKPDKVRFEDIYKKRLKLYKDIYSGLYFQQSSEGNASLLDKLIKKKIGKRSAYAEQMKEILA